MVSEKIRVFINGFGRIGRCAARIIAQDERFVLAGVNDLYDFTQMRQLLQYDSVYGAFPYEVSLSGNKLFFDGHETALFNVADPAKLALEHLNIDVVLECSGYFLTQESCRPFLERGAKNVVVSTPPQDGMPVYIRGINDAEYAGEPIVSASSCSANAIVPLLKIVDDAWRVRSAMLSMYHSYTSYQRLLDGSHYSSDIRRARSGTQNIIPLQSSAAGATASFFPHLDEKFYAKSIRVPLAAVTFYDISARVHEKAAQSDLPALFHETVTERFGEILAVSETPKVSSDYIADPHSATVDLPLCSVEEDLIRIAAWQDNEYGYTSRLLDIAATVAK